MKTKTILFDDTGVLSIDDKTANIFTILIGSLMLGILAQISIPIPFSPVPITGQTIGVVLVGALLGSISNTKLISVFLSRSINRVTDAFGIQLIMSVFF